MKTITITFQTGGYRPSDLAWLVQVDGEHVMRVPVSHLPINKPHERGKAIGEAYGIAETVAEHTADRLRYEGHEVRIPVSLY